jgi:cytochrome c551/c552
MGTNPKTIPHKRGSIIFWHFFHFSFTIVTQRHFFVTTSSSSAAEKTLKMKIWKRFFIFFVMFLISCFLFYFNYEENNTYILKTLELKGSVKEGDTLFKMNCVGCHGITARGLVGPDLHSITMRLNDAEIIKQVIEGVTPPMPSFEIDPQNMSNLLTYLHSL